MNNYRIIDCHNHIYKDKIAHKATENIGHFYNIEMAALGTAEDLAEKLQTAGIEKALVCSAATTPHQVQAINDFIHEQCLLYPQFIGFGTLHPDMENMETEIDRMLQLGFKGIKLHPDFQEFEINAPQAMKMYELIGDKMLVLFHTGDKRYRYSSPDKLAEVLESFPDLRVMAAHFGGYSEWQNAQKYLLGKNLYIDTSSSLDFITPQEAADMIHLHGADKVLFGTDYPMWLHSEELERFMQIPLTEEERVKILYKNAEKLFRI